MPVVAARSKTAGNSAWNCSSSRCAWVSMRETFTSARSRHGMSGGQRLQGLTMTSLGFQNPHDLETRVWVGDRLQVGLQHSDGLLLFPCQARQQIIQAGVVD